jgi:hypothetical protein
MNRDSSNELTGNDVGESDNSWSIQQFLFHRHRGTRRIIQALTRDVPAL